MLLALLALAAPLPAFAISDQALKPVSADPGPAALSVSASLDSCGVLATQVVCKLDVSFNPLENADSYSATVTAADGSVTDLGDVGPGGASLWVPYEGAGTYSVKITAYGAPTKPDDPDGHGRVIATDVSPSSPWKHAKDARKKDEPKDQTDAATAETQVTGRTDPSAEQNSDADGAATSEAGTSPVAPTCEPTTTAPPPDPPTPPDPPPPDLDPDNPDEDADGIPDDQEQVSYQQDLATYQAALNAQASAPPPQPSC